MPVIERVPLRLKAQHYKSCLVAELALPSTRVVWCDVLWLVERRGNY